MKIPQTLHPNCKYREMEPCLKFHRKNCHLTMYHIRHELTKIVNHNNGQLHALVITYHQANIVLKLSTYY